MEFALLGWPDDGVTLELDYREFAYAGKFVMSSTGKAVARADDAGSDDAGNDDARNDDAGNDDTGNDDGGSDDESGSDESAIVGAIAFDADRTDATVCRLRYVTVREDYRGEGIGPRLAAFVAARAAERGYERARIAVNNPFAYQAMYRAGFRFTGEETGMAELVLDRSLGGVEPADPERYLAGLDLFRERDLSEDETAFLDEKREAGPPSSIDGPA